MSCCNLRACHRFVRSGLTYEPVETLAEVLRTVSSAVVPHVATRVQVRSVATPVVARLTLTSVVVLREVNQELAPRAVT